MTTQTSATTKPRWWRACGDSKMGVGIALGVAFGVAADDLAMGIAVGVALGFLWEAQRRR